MVVWQKYCMKETERQSTVLSLERKLSNVVNLPPVRELLILGNGAISGAQCCSLLLANLVPSSSCVQVSLSE